ncbi:MAG TPA: DUF885 domain-containing protein [Conexibacter sp.]|jgi:uncharacterized protein (DUF885 family)|nr:DUF885 domain-containing protein [Conexibacter sp.]
MTTVLKIAADVWDHRLEHEPYVRLGQGLAVARFRPWGYEERRATAAFAARARARLDALDAHELSGDDRLTAGFLRFVLDGWTAAAEHFWLDFDVTPYRIYAVMNPIELTFEGFRAAAPADEQRFLSLVDDFRAVVDGLRDKLMTQRELRILLPRAALPVVIATLQSLRAAAPALVRVDAERFGVLDAAARARLAARVERLVADELLPAFDALLDVLGPDYLAAAPEHVGLWQYDGGESAYRAAVRRDTTTDHEPGRIHAIGLEQLAELSERMAAARSRLGFTGSEAEFRASLATRPELYVSTPEQVGANFRRHLARIEPHLSGWIAVMPQAPYDVDRLPPQAEEGLTYGSYEPPMPGQPVGRYLYNASHLEQRSLLNAATLVFHELVPGHHVHFMRQAENASLPLARRRCGDLHAFNEGWAEYAAGLGWEAGLYEDPFDGYGRLAEERFLAVRLVVDTGLNALGWSLEQARQAMREHTLESELQIATETLRYATDMPAQGLSYRLGFLEFTRLRASAERSLGSDFDVREFHEQILAQGALPLDVLDAHLREWAETRARAGS